MPYHHISNLILGPLSYKFWFWMSSRFTPNKKTSFIWLQFKTVVLTEEYTLWFFLFCDERNTCSTRRIVFFETSNISSTKNTIPKSKNYTLANFKHFSYTIMSSSAFQLTYGSCGKACVFGRSWSSFHSLQHQKLKLWTLIYRNT